MDQSGYQDLLNSSVVNTDVIVVGILNLPNLDANSVAIIDSSNNLSDVILNNGQVLIGRNGNAPIANTLTGTTDEIVVTPASGSITLSTPQPIATTSSPTFNSLTLNGSLAGPANTRTADNILSCSTSQTTDNLLSFSSSQKVAKDSGLLSTNVVTNAGTGATGNVATFASNKVIQDSGIPSSSLITGLTGVTGHLAEFSSSSVVSDSGISTVDVFLRTGTVPMTGNINMNTRGLTNTASIGINPLNNNVLIGDGTTLTSTSVNVRNVFIGHNNAASGFGCVLLGDQHGQTGTGNVFILGSGCTGAGSQIGILGSVSSVTGSNCYAIGDNNSVTSNANKSAILGNGNTISVNNSFVIGNSATNSTANSVLIGDSSIANIRPNNNNSCDLGATGTNTFKNIYANGSLIGASFSRTIDSIVSNAGSSTSGNLASFSSVTGKAIADSGVVASNVVTTTTGVTGNIASFVSSKVIGDSGIIAAGIVSASSGVTGNLPVFTSSKIIADSGIIATNVVTNSGSGATGNIAVFNSSTGKEIKDSAIASSNVALLTGATFTGGITGPRIAFSSADGIIGVTNGSNATAGSVGEYQTASGTSLVMSNGVVRNLAFLTNLSAGDWDVWGSMQASASGTMTVLSTSISLTSATHNTTSAAFTQINSSSLVTGGTQAFPTGTLRVSISTPTTVYLTGQSNFSSGTVTGAGYMAARRIR